MEDSKWPRTRCSVASAGWLQPQRGISSSLSQTSAGSECALPKNPSLGPHWRAESPQQGRETQRLGFWEGLEDAHLLGGEEQTAQ